MEKQARQLLLFSFVSFLLVLAFGLVRALGPFRGVLDTPETFRSMQAFHSHFDDLCWLGSGVIGASMWVFRDTWRGPPWVPYAFNGSWIAGSVFFSTSFLFKGLGEALGVRLLVEGVYPLLIFAGGCLFFVVIPLGAWITLHIAVPAARRSARSARAENGDAAGPAHAARSEQL